MGNRVAIAKKVFWNCGLDVATGGVKYRASMFIKTLLEAAFSFPNVLQIKKEALNHVDNVESITSNVRFDFVGFTRKVESRKLKHQTFLIHERHGWPRRTGSGTRFTRQMQIIKQTNVKPYERRQNNLFENVLQRFARSFVSFLRSRKHDFRRRISTFVWRIPLQLENAQCCRAANILPVGVCGTKNVWCLIKLVSDCHSRGHRGMWCSSCCCTEKNREWPGHFFNY